MKQMRQSTIDLSTQQIKNIVYKCENLLFKKMKIS